MRLKNTFPITIKSTFLVHMHFRSVQKQRKDYLKLIEEEMLPKIAKEGLADYIDVFCEKGYFSVEDMKHMNAGKYYDLIPKVHVNQFNIIGGVPLAVKLGVLSVDHLEVVDQEDIDALKSATMPTLLHHVPSFKYPLRTSA